MRRPPKRLLKNVIGPFTRTRSHVAVFPPLTALIAAGDMIQADEISNTIIVTGIPAAEQVTCTALTDKPLTMCATGSDGRSLGHGFRGVR